MSTPARDYKVQMRKVQMQAPSSPWQDTYLRSLTRAAAKRRVARAARGEAVRTNSEVSFAFRAVPETTPNFATDGIENAGPNGCKLSDDYCGVCVSPTEPASPAVGVRSSAGLGVVS